MLCYSWGFFVCSTFSVANTCRKCHNECLFLRLRGSPVITREALLLTLESKFIHEFFLKVASVSEQLPYAGPSAGRAGLPQAHCLLKALFPLILCTDLTFFFTCTCIFPYVIRIYYRIFLLCHSSILTGMALQAIVDLCC